MKKLLLSLLLTSFQMSTFAGSYEEATKVQLACDGMASISQSAFDMHEDGKKLEDLPGITLDGYTKEMLAAVQAGYDAPSADYAYQVTWAKCMDKRSAKSKKR